MQSETDSQPTAPDSRLPRLGFLLGLVVIYWVLAFVVASIEKPYFYGFIYGVFSGFLFLVLLSVWWWRNRGLSRSEKWAGYALLFGGGLLTQKLTDPSVNFFTVWTLGLPLVAGVVVVWLFLTKRQILPFSRLGFAAAVLMTWGTLLLIRMDGFDSMLRTHLSWRWTPTAEQRFLAQNSANHAAPNAPAASSAILQPSPSTWVAFRGPDRDGVLRGASVSTDWNTSPPTQVWKHAVGPAWSSLIVVGGRLYTQEQRGPVEAVVCYDSATGNQLWVHEDTTRFDEAVSGAGPRATPTFANGHVFTLGGTGILNCLDAQTGKPVWSRDVLKDSQGAPQMWGLSSSPLVVDGKVIAYGGGKAGKSLLAYGESTGDLVWTAAAGETTYSSPQLTTLAGVRQCLMFDDRGLTSVDPATGKELWKAGVPMPGTPRSGQPHLVDGNKLAVAVLDGPGVSLIEVTKEGDQWKATPVWTSKDLKPEFPDFVVRGDSAYGFDSSIFCCLNLTTGKRNWKDGRYGRGQVILLEDQGLLMIVSETGEIILQAADSQARKELGRFQAISGKTWNGPVIADGRLYLRNAEEMACYQLPAAGQTAGR